MAIYQFYPIDVSYRVFEEKCKFFVFGRTPEGASICIVDDYAPYFFAKVENNEGFCEKILQMPAQELGRVEACETLSSNLFKIRINLPDAVKQYAKQIGGMDGVLVFGDDVPLYNLYIAEKGLALFNLCEVEGEKANYPIRSDLIIKAGRIENVDGQVYSPRILAFDVEMQSFSKDVVGEEPIKLISLVGKNFRKTITWKRIEGEDVEVVASEMDLLRRFNELVLAYDPDVIVGYGSEEFDWPYIFARSQKYNLWFRLGRYFGKLRVRDYNGRTYISGFNGIINFDIKEFLSRYLKNHFYGREFYIEAVSNYLFWLEGMESSQYSIFSMENSADTFEQLMEGTLKHAQLTYMLFDEHFYLLCELAKITGVKFSKLFSVGPVRNFENFILREALQNNVEVPHLKEFESEGYDHLFTERQPTPGVYNNVYCFGFENLFAGLIIQNNISPDLCQEKECKSGSPGFFSGKISEIMQKKKNVNLALKQQTSEVLENKKKVLDYLLRAVPWYLQSKHMRWYCEGCYGILVNKAHEMMSMTINIASKNGLEVIFVSGDKLYMTVSEGGGIFSFKQFETEINAILLDPVVVQLKDKYMKGVFLPQRASDKGARNKYGLLSENGEIILRGVEAMRSDWTKIARELQLKVISVILKKNNIERGVEIFRNYVSSVKNYDVDLVDLTFKTQLQKEIEQYDVMSPAIKVGQMLREHGEDIGKGSVVSYLVVKGEGEKLYEKVKPAKFADVSEMDTGYYIEYQLFPVVEPIFRLFGYKKEDLI